MTDDNSFEPPLRPSTRGDCADGPRPCPWVGCSMHLYLDVHQETGAIKYNFPGVELDDLQETCALDVADRGGLSLQEVGEHLSVTRERARQIEGEAMFSLETRLRRLVSDELPLGRRVPGAVRRLAVLQPRALTPPAVEAIAVAPEPLRRSFEALGIEAMNVAPAPAHRPTPAEVRAADIAAMRPLKPHRRLRDEQTMLLPLTEIA